MRSDILFPSIFGISVFLIVFGFFAYVRYLRYRETITMAEKGLAYPERRNGKDTLRWGIVIAAIGIALIIGVFPEALRDSWPLLLVGLLPTFFGLGLVLIYVVTREEQPKPERESETEGESAPLLDE